MSACVVHPIPLFEFDFPKSHMADFRFGNELARMAGYVWYIEGIREKVLVDAGSGEALSDFGIPFTEVQTLDAGLGKLGVGLDDITLIIPTHLHTDHVTQVHRFPRARLMVQKDELECARNPHPAVAGEYYPREFLDGLKFEVVQGDTVVSREVSVLSTPGHSSGGQSVSVQTARGTVIIAGLCTIRESFYPPPTMGTAEPVITPGLHTNIFDAYDSVLRIKKMADIVVTLHDIEYRRREAV